MDASILEHQVPSVRSGAMRGRRLVFHASGLGDADGKRWACLRVSVPGKGLGWSPDARRRSMSCSVSAASQASVTHHTIPRYLELNDKHRIYRTCIRRRKRREKILHVNACNDRIPPLLLRNDGAGTGPRRPCKSHRTRHSERGGGLSEKIRRKRRVIDKSSAQAGHLHCCLIPRRSIDKAKSR